MCDASGETPRHVAASGLETLTRTGEGRAASAPAIWTHSRNATRCQTAPAGRPVGGGVSQILAGIARSVRRILRKGKPAIRKKENEVKRKHDMCPACIANITVMAAGATSGGGVVAFVFRSFYRSSKQIKTENNQNENQRSRQEKEPSEPPQNRFAEGVGGCAPAAAREREEVDPRS